MIPTVYVKHRLANTITITRIIALHYFELDKNFVFQGELHDFWELVYVDRGKAVITAETSTFVLPQGEMVFHKPNEFHKVSADGVTAPNILVLSFECRSKAMSFFQGKRLVLPENLRNLLALIINEGKQAFTMFSDQTDCLLANKDAPIGAQQLIRLYLEELLILLLRENAPTEQEKLMFSTKESYGNHLVTVIVDLMESRLYQNLTVDEICHALGYGKTYLSTLFRQATGSSMKEYYFMLKAAEAKRLIREHNYTMDEISQQLAFDTPQYFSRWFKRYTGMSPREYARSVPIQL